MSDLYVLWRKLIKLLDVSLELHIIMMLLINWGGDLVSKLDHRMANVLINLFNHANITKLNLAVLEQRKR